MTPGDAEGLVRRYIEDVWNRGDISRFLELTSPQFTYHLAGQPARDGDAFGRFLAAMRVAFPDWRVEVDTVLAEPSAVAVRWHARATHRGPFRGIPATGRTIHVTGINVYVLEQDKVATEWEQMDSLGMLQQLGVLPG